MVKSKKYTGVYYRQLKADKSYYITYKMNSKKVWQKIGLHSEGVREAYCFKKRAEITASLRLGEVPDLVKRKHAKTFHEVAVEFFEHKHYHHNTYRDYLSRYNRYIKPDIGDISVINITKKDIQIIYDKTISLRSPKTAQLVTEFINSVFLYAISEGYTKTNPCKIRIQKVDNKRERFLSKEEMTLLLKEVHSDYDLHLFVLLALTTGGRLGAVCAIKKKDINIPAKIIYLLDDKNDEVYQAFLSDRVGELLHLDGLSPNDSIFKKKQRTIQRKLQPILNRLFNQNLDKADRKNRVVIHTLRHTFASHLAINGTPIFTIQKLMNHKDITQTLRYAKLAPDSGRDMIEGIL